MGQGYSLTTLSAGAAGIDVPELADLTYEKSLGNARFMKAIRARHKDGLVIAKVVVKPYASMKLDEYKAALFHERKVLADVPNALAYHRILETSDNGFLVRQYIYSSLYDRMSTRPFLEDIEKKWLAFQLLSAVRDCHSHDIFHGEIKTENILVTSWNWLYLADFSSSFKPTYLPEDNPSDFGFYFDTSGRRTCYLAPERFLKAPRDPAEGVGKVNWAMDMFSVGCVIAELFLETPIFSLSQLFEYKQGNYDPYQAHLRNIEDKDIREMVSTLIKLDPNARYNANDCLVFYRKKAFPDYFYGFLHNYMHSITDPSAGRGPVTNGDENNGEADERIDKVYNDFDKISYFLGYGSDQSKKRPEIRPTLRSDLFPLHVDIPNYQHEASNAVNRTSDDGTLIFLTLISASIRSTARATGRVRACELLLAFAERTTDETKLDRILPYLVVLLNDKNDLVRIAALRTITQVLALVKVVSPINAYVFPEYIIPRLEPFLPGWKPTKKQLDDGYASPSPLVRATYASCLATLATTASRFLDIMQALRADGSLPTNDPEAEEDLSKEDYQDLYDQSHADLVYKFEIHTKAFLTDSDPAVRRAFLGSVSSLCVFFQDQKAQDVILSHLNTYLNDKDWMLKCAFFETIVGVGVYVGAANLEEFILPLMMQALTDPEEFVVEKALRSLSALAELGSIQRSKAWELIDIVGRFSMHPNIWIREAAAQFITSTAKNLALADAHSIVVPLLKPYLKVEPSDLSEFKLLDSLKKPLPRLVMDIAQQWSVSAEKGLFWRSAQQQRMFSLSSFEDAVPTISARELGPKALSRTPKNDEDEQWIKKLRNAGMTHDDDFKLLALREYIWKASHRRKQSDDSEDFSQFNRIIPLQDLHIQPQTVFFDEKRNWLDAAVNENVAYDQDRPNTIAEALRDAHKSSAMSLMARGDSTNKATAETGMTSTNAFGKVDTVISPREETKNGRSSPLAVAQELHRKDPGKIRFQAAHDYSGNDPTVLKLLDSLYLENYPIDTIEFGPEIQPLKKGNPIRRNNSLPSNTTWRPEGTLVATMGEHTAAINRVLVSPDHAFFITASNDGTVKVWDTSRLERNITHKSRATHRQGGDGVRVTSICFIERSHCFVSTGSDGSVHVVKTVYNDNAPPTTTTPTPTPSPHPPKYGKPRILRTYQLPPSTYAVWTSHHRSPETSTSILLLATNTSQIHALDLRSMTLLYTLSNPLPHGPPTCFTTDRKHHYLILGTAHGVLSLWDLRFRLRLRAWRFPASGPINRIVSQALKSRSKNRFIVAGGTNAADITIWDLEKGICTHALRASVFRDTAASRAAYSLIDLDEVEEKAGRSSGLTFLSPLSTLAATSNPTPHPANTSAPRTTTSTPSTDPTDFILATGPDWKVRYWDLAHPTHSTVVSGADPQQSVYAVLPPAAPNPETLVVREVLVGPAGGAEAARPKLGSRHPSGRDAAATNMRALQQQQLLRGHLDDITDVALVEWPYGMVVSVDRAGVVFVFQ
ncbi:phosphoinositide 3-kinase regulatory subunit 4 [Saccharata proteae CBS 121410]|uniref:non-specific serine/threonine protein kinase n=1 Tax=Saccharata proteae CBS 121410 TaxID=1314787 RepID=A0A9P4HQ93_9PEZI|nr:phosphoinositide 3-kinase regulatory subunit 4 [Saccharata proteae CBS 121410]